MPENAPPNSRLMRLAVIGSALVMVAGAGAFYVASAQRPAPASGADQIVLVTASACEPNAITVAAGDRSFEIRNNSDRPIEWEILDGVMVVAERENIVPGYTQMLTAKLAPGTYAMTCGLLSNPRGTLTVTSSDEWSNAVAQIGLREFLGPLSEYKVYLLQKGKEALEAVEELAQAIKAGDLDEAKSLWLAARLAYNRIEPVAYRFSDLESAIDPLAVYLAEREADPDFTGFHRIEYGLFAQNSLDGLVPVASQLVVSMQALRDRLSALALDPQLLLAIPGDMANQLATGKVLRDESLYAHSDLAELGANLAGIEKVALLLGDVVAPADPELAEEVTLRLTAIKDRLAQLDTDQTPPSPEAREGLAAAFTALADTLERLGASLRGA